MIKCQNINLAPSSIFGIFMLSLISLNANASEPKYKYYLVEGHDFNSLNASIFKNRPNGFNTMHESHISWRFNFKHKDGKCYIVKPVVDNKVIITLPKWINSQGAPAKLVAEWQRFIKALKLHQLGHVSFSYKSQHAILAAFKHFKAENKCEKLKIKANIAAKLILKDFDAQDRQYENSTKKGLTQGALLQELPK